MVGRHQDLAVHARLDHPLHDAVGRDMDQERTEFVTDHEAAVVQGLDALEVEIGAGQIALLRALVGDAEGDATQRVAQENGLEECDPAALPVGTGLVEHQQRVGAVAAIAEAVVGQDPVAAGLAGDRLDAGKALHRLSDERECDPGGTIAVERAGIAHHRAGRVDAQVARPGELAGQQGVARRIGRRERHREGRQQRMAGERGVETLVGGCRQGCEHGGGKKETAHRDTLRQILARKLPTRSFRPRVDSMARM
jgi:hypothetical protein